MADTRLGLAALTDSTDSVTDLVPTSPPTCLVMSHMKGEEEM